MKSNVKTLQKWQKDTTSTSYLKNSHSIYKRLFLMKKVLKNKN